MIEQEVKMRLLVGAGEADRILRSLGYSFTGEVYEKDLYLQHPCRDFAETDEALRIRRRSGRVESVTMTYKGPRTMDNGVKKRLEIQVMVDSYDAAAELLARLGFSPVALVEKKRRLYKKGDTEASIDTLATCGGAIYLEVEGSIEDIEEAVRAFRGRAVIVDETYLEIVLGGCR